jgi:hypothetical protein
MTKIDVEDRDGGRPPMRARFAPARWIHLLGPVRAIEATRVCCPSTASRYSTTGQRRDDKVRAAYATVTESDERVLTSA